MTLLPPDSGLVEGAQMSDAAKSLGPASGQSAVLGRNALKSRATARSSPTPRNLGTTVRKSIGSADSLVPRPSAVADSASALLAIV